MYGSRIRQLRKSAGLSQEELASRVGISRPNISFWEKSQYPPLDAVARVCGALGIEIWKFFLTDDAVTRSLDIPSESIEIYQRMSRLDDVSRRDVEEIFDVILSKYERLQERQTAVSPEMSSGTDAPGTHPATMKIRSLDDEFSLIINTTRKSGMNAMEEYLNRFLWVNMFIQ